LVEQWEKVGELVTALVCQDGGEDSGIHLGIFAAQLDEADGIVTLGDLSHAGIDFFVYR
jgi:hypothetical protein